MLMLYSRRSASFPFSSFRIYSCCPVLSHLSLLLPTLCTTTPMQTFQLLFIYIPIRYVAVVFTFQPEFAEPIVNISVAVGRDATFTCHVRHLGGYRVSKVSSSVYQDILIFYTYLWLVMTSNWVNFDKAKLNDLIQSLPFELLLLSAQIFRISHKHRWHFFHSQCCTILFMPFSNDKRAFDYFNRRLTIANYLLIVFRQ